MHSVDPKIPPLVWGGLRSKHRVKTACLTDLNQVDSAGMQPILIGTRIPDTERDGAFFKIEGGKYYMSRDQYSLCNEQL